MENISNQSLFLYGIMLFAILIEIFLMLKNFSAKSWSQTKGRITNNEIDLNGHGSSNALEAKIDYTYMVNGKEYQSNNVAYATLGTGFALFRKFYIRTDDITVFYNPQKPQSAVLLPGIRLFHVLDIGLILGLGYYIYTVVGI